MLTSKRMWNSQGRCYKATNEDNEDAKLEGTKVGQNLVVLAQEVY